jgi:small subunit ribosomal protein S9
MAEAVYHAVGKRKTSVARVWLKPGDGTIVINNKPMKDFITVDSGIGLINQPLELTENLGKYDVIVNVRGGGVLGQAGAIRHGISRALLTISPDYRLILKKADLLTRDPRMKERKKYGQAAARARFQYSKR